MNQTIQTIINDEKDATEVARAAGVPVADVSALRRILSKIKDETILASIIEAEEPATVLAERHGLRESDIRAVRNLAGLGRRRVEAAVVSLRIRNDLALKVTTPIRRQLQQLVEKELESASATEG